MLATTAWKMRENPVDFHLQSSRKLFALLRLFPQDLYQHGLDLFGFVAWATQLNP